ncbi:sensor histidine kinase [uncultured Roseovarius sp.]|uniref:sensor histidine kinase n=1 Tax=Roseovarius sp. TaxID=1486281 RepID=UPI0025D9CFD2|nr:HAMP domain-containing sensor histidine kinase [uncultured Roseovarius sp.]
MRRSGIDQPKATVESADARLLQNLKDYTWATFALLWQRQAIYLATTLLTAFYFDPLNAAIFYCTIVFCELQDIMIARRVRRLHVNQKRAIHSSLIWVLLNTILSSAAICLYAVSIAFKQELGGHFTPLFFLFAAALFAAMNNHQLVLALGIRLGIYGLSFLVIVFSDIWISRPSLDSELWLHFFTVIFVMYFLIDCSIVFLRLYRKNLAQLEALRQEHERTKAAYVVKSQFISTVSHELRTPLTSIRGSLDLLNSGVMGEVPEKMKSLLNMAGKNSKRLSNLIDDVLDLQKIEAGEMNYRKDILSVQALVNEAVNSNVGYATAHNVTLVEECPEDTPLTIEGDETRLMQVLANMISNAAKFSKEGGTVTVGCKSIGDKVRIYVKDTGCGIPEGAESKVFGRFSQLDSSDQRRAAGSGLGMNISKEIVESHNGIIDYVSEIGCGTTFFTEFLAHRAPPELP